MSSATQRVGGARGQMRLDWHWVSFRPPSDWAHGALAILAADRWCEDNVEFGRWCRRGNFYYFERQHDAVLFKLTWM
jgi:hypothetical protein